jgi:4-carboxymuconolactone decarboxylase
LDGYARQRALSGKRAGLTDQEILRITKGPNAEGWNSFDATLLQAVDELHKDAFISDSTWVALSKQYTEQQIMDLIFTVG